MCASDVLAPLPSSRQANAPQRSRLVGQWLIAALSSLGFASVAAAGSYEQVFNFPVDTTNLGDGSAITEAAETGVFVAGVKNATQTELQLTQLGTNGTRSAFRLPQLDAGSAISAFSVRWSGSVYTNGAFGDGNYAYADGFSFNFGNLPADLTSGATENGFGTGLTLGVRTYPYGGPGFRAYVNGAEQTVVASTNYFAATNGARNYFEVDWSATSGMSFRVNGAALITNSPTTSFTPTAGMVMAFGARTGGVSEEFNIDNLAVVTNGTLRNVAMSVASAFSNKGSPVNEGPGNAFDNSPGLAGATNTSGVAVSKWLGQEASATIGARTADGQRHRVTAYTLVSGNDGQDRHPMNWTFEGSIDGTNWSVLDTVAGERSSLGFNTPRTFLVNTPGDFDYYRLNITSTNGANIVQLDDILLYETAAVPEPATAALVGLGLGGLLTRRRRVA